MLTSLKKFLTSLLLTIVIIAPTAAIAGPITISDTNNPLPTQMVVNTVKYGKYEVTAIPNQTIEFKNSGLELVPEAGYCTATQKMNAGTCASSGICSSSCIAKVKFTAPSVPGTSTPKIKTCVKGLRICTEHPISIETVAAKLESITITPTNSSIPEKAKLQFKAMGLYSNSKTPVDITDQVTWKSSETTVATIDVTGKATAKAAGTTTITGKDNVSGKAATATLSVTSTSVTLTSITINPSNPKIANGIIGKFTATGKYSDNSTADITNKVIWSSGNNNLALINVDAVPGVIKAKNTGSTTITATDPLSKISGVTSLVIKQATLSKIDITPPNPTITITQGTTIQPFAAIGTYTDGSTADVSKSVTWTTKDLTVATVSASGLATIIKPGSTIITVKDQLSSISSTTTLNATTETLQSITITPSSSNIAKGKSLQLTAMGAYSNTATPVDITNQVAWSSNDTNKATINSAGTITALAEGVITITGQYAGASNTAILTITQASLKSINVTPTNATVTITQGAKQLFTATGTYTDGSTKDLTTSVSWTSKNPTVATIDSTGLATINQLGSTVITANDQLSNISNTATLNATNTTLQKIEIIPANPNMEKGATQQFTALGTYSNSTIPIDITKQVKWDTSNSNVATLIDNGIINAVGTVGSSAIITATDKSSNIGGATQVTVTAATLQSIKINVPYLFPLPVNLTEQLTAIGTYTDGSTKDITHDTNITWSSDSGVATVIGGLLTAVSAGSATIKAIDSLSSIENYATITIVLAQLSDIYILQNNQYLTTGTKQQFNVLGIYGDLAAIVTNKVTWNSSNPNVATVDPTGMVTVIGNAGDSATITAKDSISTTISSQTNLTITAAKLQSIEVIAPYSSIPIGVRCSLMARGHYSDGTSRDITSLVDWTSSNPQIANIYLTFLTPLAIGSTNITATLGQISGQTTLAVTAATLNSIKVSADYLLVPFGFNEQFIATATYSDGSTYDISNSANWISSNTAVASTTSGYTYAHTVVGETNIISYLGSTISSASTLNVVKPQIIITPTTASIPVGSTQQFTATIYPPGYKEPTTWVSSSNGGVATIDSNGLATAVLQGQASIYANSWNYYASASATLSITAAP